MRIEQGQRPISMARLFLAASLLTASASVSSQTDMSVLPVNAHTSRYGSSWECSRGFRRVEEACVAIKGPANAYLNSFGSDWDCNRGYRKGGQGGKAVKGPGDAHPDDEPFSPGWQCNRGYREASGGCTHVVVPGKAYSAASSSRSG